MALYPSRMPPAAALTVAASLLASGAAADGRLRVTAELPMSARVLDIAAAGGGRVVVLMDGALALLRLDARQGLVAVDERHMAVASVVRAPAGILLADPGGDTCWVATNQSDVAILYSLAGDRLWEVQRAAALPWPGARRGLAFRPATNLIDVEIAGLGGGPFVRVGAGWAIGNDGVLGFAGTGWTGTRVGSAAALVGDRVLAVSGADPPGAKDRVTLLREGGAPPERALEIAGTVTALAATRRGGVTYVIAGAARDGAYHLALIEVGPDAP